MKKIVLYLFIISTVVIFNSCRDDDPSGQSIFVNPEEPKPGSFDYWLLENYAMPYGINFKYKMEDIESSMNYQLVPATVDNAKKIAVIVKYAWLEAYDEIAGIDFTSSYVPKIIHIVGSSAYNSNNTEVLGTAEGGMKITFYSVNGLRLDAEYLNSRYLHTMHHEFAHILHQTKSYDPDFPRITEGQYIADSWYLGADSVALQSGFITKYSRKNADEDFVEILSNYVTKTQEEWDALLLIAGRNDNPGRAIINEKFEIVRKYLRDSWNIDIDQLRSIVLKRTAEVERLNFDI